jgi:hypothetical protein
LSGEIREQSREKGPVDYHGTNLLTIRSSTLFKKKKIFYILLLDYAKGSIQSPYTLYNSKMHCTNAINVQDDVGMIKIQGSKTKIQARAEW